MTDNCCVNYSNVLLCICIYASICVISLKNISFSLHIRVRWDEIHMAYALFSINFNKRKWNKIQLNIDYSWFFNFILSCDVFKLSVYYLTRSVKCQTPGNVTQTAGILFAVCFLFLLYFVGLFFFFGETQPTVKIFVAAAARVTSGKYRYALSHKFSALKNKRRKKKSKARKKRWVRKDKMSKFRLRQGRNSPVMMMRLTTLWWAKNWKILRHVSWPSRSFPFNGDLTPIYPRRKCFMFATKTHLYYTLKIIQGETPVEIQRSELHFQALYNISVVYLFAQPSATFRQIGAKHKKKKATRLYTQKMSNKSQSTPIKSNINFIRARQNKKHIPSILCEAQKCIGGVYCCFAVCSCNAKAFMSFMKRTNNIWKCLTGTTATIWKRFTEQQLVEWAEGQLVTKMWSLWAKNKCGSRTLCAA